jgi:hypothetical protein
MVLIQAPPKLVYDGRGKLVEVIVQADDYIAYVKALAKEADWESLPEHLQDAVDRLLVDEVRSEKNDTVDLDVMLAG